MSYPFLAPQRGQPFGYNPPTYSVADLRYNTPVQDDDFGAYGHPSSFDPPGHISFSSHHPPRYSTPGPYGPLPSDTTYTNRNPYTPETSPPTPSQRSETSTTRNKRNARKESSAAKPLSTKAGRVNKKKRAPKPRDTSVNLPKPLSELARDVPEVVVADIAAFVARSKEERGSEVSRSKKSDRVKRPMNAFMLYRKAYQDVAKAQGTEKNHQVVSKVCGASWPMESEEIHGLFNRWAQLERDNHQKAHPGYKFTPSKPRKGKRDEDMDGASTVLSDAGDSDWANAHDYSQRPQRTERATSCLSEAPSVLGNRIETMDHIEAPHVSLGVHHYDTYTSPGRPLPLQYGQLSSSPFEQSISHRVNSFGFSPDVPSRSPSPALHFGLQAMHDNPGYSGMNDSREYSSPLDQGTSPPVYQSFHFEEVAGMSREASLGPPEVWSPQMDDGHDWVSMGASYESEGTHDAYLRGKQGDWQVEELDEASQFEHWIKQTEEGLA